MTTRSSPPKRRRRRLIVTFVVLVSLVVAGWYWPRIDNRFVGKWKVTTTEAGFHFGPLKLTDDGQGEALVSRNRDGSGYSAMTYRFPWRRQGSDIVLYREHKSPRWAYLKRAMMAAYAYTKNPVFLERETYSLHWEGEGLIELNRTLPASSQSFLPDKFIISRIPE